MPNAIGLQTCVDDNKLIRDIYFFFNADFFYSSVDMI
jgi:hypothetical protein